MDATELRELQKPLRDKYRDDPESAETPVHAYGSFDADGVTCTVRTPAGPVVAGLHPATGGEGDVQLSGDMLLQALVASVGVTLRSVATAQGVTIASAGIHAEAAFDARGTLGLSREAPIGVTDVLVSVVLDSDADDAQLARLAELTERYSVVAHSLYEPPRLVFTRAD